MLYKVYQLQYYSFDNFPQFSRTKLKPSVHDDRTLTIKELQDGVNFVIKSFQRMKGGEVYIPKIASSYITDLAKAIAPNATLKNIGIRPGEKLHEIMCPRDAYVRTLEFSDHFVIMPTIDFPYKVEYSKNMLGEEGKPVPKDFEYNSGNNSDFLTCKKIEEMIECY